MKSKKVASDGLHPWQEYEIVFQSKLTIWAWNHHPETRGHIWAVPNGMLGNQIVTTQAIASGLVGGVHDLMMHWTGHPLQTFELKVKGRSPSADQIWFGREVIKHGGRAYLIDEANNGEELFKEIVLETIGRRVPSLESYIRFQDAQKVFQPNHEAENALDAIR